MTRSNRLFFVLLVFWHYDFKAPKRAHVRPCKALCPDQGQGPSGRYTTLRAICSPGGCALLPLKDATGPYGPLVPLRAPFNEILGLDNCSQHLSSSWTAPAKGRQCSQFFKEACALTPDTARAIKGPMQPNWPLITYSTETKSAKSGFPIILGLMEPCGPIEPDILQPCSGTLTIYRIFLYLCRHKNLTYC